MQSIQYATSRPNEFLALTQEGLGNCPCTAVDFPLSKISLVLNTAEGRDAHFQNICRYCW